MDTDDGAVIAGIVLAAGAGRRYGRPKVLVNGWLSTAVTALAAGGCTHVVVVLGAAVVPVPAEATAVVARDWESGLSASVRTGLDEAARIGADYAVLDVVDTPDVGAPVVARVIKRALASRGGLARASYRHGPGHPVALAKRHWKGVIAAMSGDHGAGVYLRGRTDVDVVDCSDLASGRDYDEPAGG